MATLDRPPLGPRDALLVVHVQNDFLPGGSLPVAGGDAVIPVLDRYVAAAVAHGARVFASRDWHPPDHCSFRSHGGPWPPHCVQGTRGAAFAPGLHLPPDLVVVSTGTDPQSDAYSAFDGPELDAALRAARVDRLLVGGLATDWCVLYTVRDALARGIRVELLEDAVRGIDAERSARARAEMLERGATPTTFERLTAA